MLCTAVGDNPVEAMLWISLLASRTQDGDELLGSPLSQQNQVTRGEFDGAELAEPDAVALLF
ncbi:hypothetical protein SAMN05216421_3214 [Halopseudomonas xinjiangensis]|uniref:Uncharacterized protein n=1 Tax=Halopseudomonas xinjiangensis TaxID=487184 RepID=A0A1H1YNT4_9GAMM|nr:hypothetical protein SAMN05216421_3214 [Halopseudomonas xinjiangensis]